jgi:GAF domain-containing protein
LDVDFTILSRHESDGAQVSVGAWSSTGDAVPFPIGTRVGLGGRDVLSLVVQTGGPARIEQSARTSGPGADDWGLRSAVGAPINVEGGLWGVMAVAAGQERLLPADTETRLAGFSGLVAAAVADAQARVELRGFAEEQAALRRVATLVGGAAPPEDVFAAVTAEIGRVLRDDVIVLNRYDPDDTETVLGAWSSTGIAPVAVDTRVRLGGRNVSSLVFGSGRPVRIDDHIDERCQPGRSRDNNLDHPSSADESVPDRRGIRAQGHKAGDGQRSGSCRRR